MSKWKWIAQDKNGEIYKFDVEPTSNDCSFVSGGIWKLVKIGKQNPNFRETLINLETEDYKIKNGILTRKPRKTELDKLIANVRKIDMKAAKWMNKNRHKLSNTKELDCCFTWNETKQGSEFWVDINDKLFDFLYSHDLEQESAKEILTYRVGLYTLNNKNLLLFATDEESESISENWPDFIRWISDWKEIEV